VSVNAPGYNLFQAEWIDFVKNSISSAPPHLQGYLRTLSVHDNVPRKQPQFANHVQTTFHLQGQHGIATSNRLWEFLKGDLEKKTAIALSRQKELLTASQGVGVGGSGGGLDKSPRVSRQEHHSETGQSQDARWRLALSIDKAPSYLRGHLQTIVDLKVVPHSKGALLDVVKNTLNLRAKALDEVWKYIVKHVYSDDHSPQQHSKTGALLRGSMSPTNSGANTEATQSSFLGGHSSISTVGKNVTATAAPAASRGYSTSSSMAGRFEPRAVSDTASTTVAAAADQAGIRDAQASLNAAGTTTASKRSCSRAPDDAESALATTNRTVPAQPVRPGNALNAAIGTFNNVSMATQNAASLTRRQGNVVTASSVAAVQLPLENRTPSTVVVSRKTLLSMKIEADDQKQPFSGFHPQHQTTGRNEVTVVFQKEQNPTAIPSATLCKRIKEWDPFWEPTFVLVTDLTGNVESPKGKTWARTAAQVTVDLEKARRWNDPTFSQEAKCEWGGKKTIGDLKERESRLLLKMIPLHPPSGAGKKAKADGHLWPKGTFLQITNGLAAARIRIQQRKQQQHNEKLWKDMSNYLDLTQHISPVSLRQPFKIELICHDEEPFFICVALCRYRSADAIFKMLTTPSSIAPIRRVFESKEEAQRKIVDLASSQMIVLDDDDGTPEKEEHAGVFSFSLVDSYSKKLIKTPVRGCRCAHFQVRSFVVALAAA
jgi:hypothetical protein